MFVYGLISDSTASTEWHYNSLIANARYLYERVGWDDTNIGNLRFVRHPVVGSVGS